MFSLLYFAVILVFYSVVQCNGQIIQFGNCKDIQTVDLFDLERFIGEWYEIKRYPTWYEKGGHCASKVFSVCGRRIAIEHKYVKNEIAYVLHMNSTYAPGDEAVFEVNATNIDPIGTSLSVLATDYTNYAIIFGCEYNEKFLIRYISAWILSRKTVLDPDLLEEAQKYVKSMPMANNVYFEDVRHDDEMCRFHWTAHVNGEQEK